MAKKKKKSKKIIVILIVALIIVVGGISVISIGAKAAIGEIAKGTTVTQEDIASKIFTRGEVISKEHRNVASDLAGKVKEILVKEGDSVQEGDTLAILDKDELEYNLKELELELAIAKESLKQLRSKSTIMYDTSFKNATINYENKKKDHEDAEELYNSGVYSEAQLNGAKTALETAKIAYEAEKKNYQGSNNVSDINIQEMRIESIQLKLDKLQENIANTEIKAPMGGTITAVNVKEMDLVGTTGALFTIQDIKDLEVVTNISQYDIGRIVMGQSVKITSDGVPGETFEGAISEISTIAKKAVSSQGQETVVQVKIDLDSEDGKFRPNYTANVEIIISEEKDAVVIPYETIYTNEEGTKLVYTVVDNVIHANEVELGIEGDLKVQVTSDNIKSEDVLYVNPHEGLSEGMEVFLMGVDE